MTMFWTGVAVVAAVATAGISAYSAAEAADSRKKQLEYQTAVQKNNAKVAEWQRSLALKEGEQQAATALQQKALLQSRQRVALAANGVDTSQGSALDILATTEYYSAVDVNNIQTTAARKAWGYENEGKGLNNDAAFANYQSSSISPTRSGAIAGASSLLSSASSYGASK